MNAYRHILPVLALLGPGVLSPSLAAAQLRIVTTTEDLAAIARDVGGEQVVAEALCRGYQDPHFVDARPSYLVKLNKADLFVQVGLDLEVGWAPALLNSARNARILPGAPGFLDASQGVEVLEIPASVSRALGDVHPLGNPHYWLDPGNGIIISRNIRDALIRLRPAEAGLFTRRQSEFETRLTESVQGLKAQAERLHLKGMKVVTYHRAWSYFVRAFGLDVVGLVEPRPGVPPSASHTHSLINTMKTQAVRLLIVEPYYDVRLPERIARDTGSALVILPTSVGAEKRIDSYADLFEHQMDLLERALAETGS